MPISAKFLADFSDFNAAVQKAEHQLVEFASGASRVEKSLSRMVDSFSGRKVVQDATLMAEAIERIGGVSKLTEGELRRVSRTANDALVKLRAMGQEVPPGLQRVADATKAMVDPLQKATSGFDKLSVAVGTFVGNLAYNVLQRGVSALVNVGREAITSAGHIDDLSKQLGISAEAVQGFSFAAEQSGTTIDTMATAITRLNINLAEGDKGTVAALKAVGLEFSAVRAMRPEEAFLTIADAIRQIPDPMEQVRVGAALMGKGFADILPAIKDGLRETALAADTMSDDTVRRLAAAEDAWAALGRKVTIVTGEMIASVAKFYEQLQREGFLFGALGKAADRTGHDIELLPPVIAKLDPAVRKADAAMEDWARTAKLLADKLEAARLKQEAFLYSVRGASYDVRKLLEQTWNLPPSIASENASAFLAAWQHEFDLTKALPPDIEQQAASAGEAIATPLTRSFLDTFAEDLSYGVSQNLTDMLVGLQKFEDGFTNIWRGIRFAVSNILADMLSDFLQNYLKRLLAELAGARLAQATAGVLMGAGTAAAAGTAASAAGGAAAGGAGAGFLTNPAFWSNPFTIGVAGAAAMGLGIWKGGLFRGGQEALKVNPARDQFFRMYQTQFGGSQYDALQRAFAARGVSGRTAEALIQQVYAADTMDELNRAITRIGEMLGPTGRLRGGLLQGQGETHIHIESGAIVVDGVGRDAHDIAQFIAPQLVDVILRENPDGVRTRLRRGLQGAAA